MPNQANDVPPYEALYVRLSRGRHGLCFYPFGEVVGCHDHHASAPVAGGIGRSYQVDYPLHERPRTRLPGVARWQAVLVSACSVGSGRTFVLTP